MQLNKSGDVAPSHSAYEHSRRDVIRDDIAKRLRHVCAHLSDKEFAKLVETMVDQKLKGERTRSL
jgi:hypothetical protein